MKLNFNFNFIFPTGSDGSGGDGTDFHKQKRSNDTHASTTDPDARLYRKGKGKEAKLSYAGHVLMENRNGLAVDGQLTKATGVRRQLLFPVVLPHQGMLLNQVIVVPI